MGRVYGRVKFDFLRGKHGFYGEIIGILLQCRLVRYVVQFNRRRQYAPPPAYRGQSRDHAVIYARCGHGVVIVRVRYVDDENVGGLIYVHFLCVFRGDNTIFVVPILPVYVGAGRGLVFFEAGHPIKIKPNIRKVYLGQQRIDDGEIFRSYFPILTVCGKGVLAIVHLYARYSGAPDKALYRSHVWRPRRNIISGLGFGLFEPQRPVVCLYGVLVLAVFGVFGGQRAYHVYAERILYAILDVVRPYLVVKIIHIIVVLKHSV